MNIDFQNVFAILATFECLSIWKFDEYSGRGLVITLETPDKNMTLPKARPPIEEIKGEDINVKHLLKTSLLLMKINIRHWFACVLPASIKRFCRFLQLKIIRFLIWFYNELTFVLKGSVVITVPILSLSYLFQIGCKENCFMYHSIVAWFIVGKISLLLFCRLILVRILLKYTEVSGGKGVQKEDSAITK